MIRRRNLFLLFCTSLVLAVFLFTPSAALAQDPQPTPSDNDVNRIAKKMYCPVCESTPLDVCPTTACQEWRELIRLRLSQGWSDQQILDYFAQQYGDRVLADPPRRGLNLVVYILPVVALLAGALIVWRVITSMRPRRSLASATDGDTTTASTALGGAGAQQSANLPAKPADDPYLARFEEELKKKE